MHLFILPCRATRCFQFIIHNHICAVRDGKWKGGQKLMWMRVPEAPNISIWFVAREPSMYQDVAHALTENIFVLIFRKRIFPSSSSNFLQQFMWRDVKFHLRYLSLSREWKLFKMMHIRMKSLLIFQNLKQQQFLSFFPDNKRCLMWCCSIKYQLTLMRFSWTCTQLSSRHGNSFGVITYVGVRCAANKPISCKWMHWRANSVRFK